MSYGGTSIPLVTVAALALIPLTGKLIGPLLGATVTKIDNRVALSAGLMAKGITETALLLVLFERGMIGEDLFSLLVLIMFIYVIGSPP